ncbi:MAG: exodeoxyribonuclease VII large subunit, partial [Chlamydiae bacterium]|nr:exodeoxyribonuclease VII large subunit [Chlamydiota bacterium]
GDQVILYGELSVYAPRGNYQLIVKTVEFVGIGSLLVKLHELKSKLQAEGLFEIARKKALPKFPKIIGIVTSPTGAVIQDILHVIERRSKGIHILLNPVKVQGEGAAKEIAKGIEDFNKHNACDVIIVGRGGGSLEDLWAFNEEIVVRAIANSIIPIISAVGHETDFSLSDFAADVRAPTPSAAAEICTAEKTQQLHFLSKTESQLRQIIRLKIESNKRQILHIQRHPYISSGYHILSSKFQDMDESRQKLDRSISTCLSQIKLKLDAKTSQMEALKPINQLKTYKEKFLHIDRAIRNGAISHINQRKILLDKGAIANKLDQSMLSEVRQKKGRFQMLLSHLLAVNPKNLLEKGYCILFSEKKDSVILSTHDVEVNQNINILMKDGELLAEIKRKQ